jgi:hypothetical protein
MDHSIEFRFLVDGDIEVGGAIASGLASIVFAHDERSLVIEGTPERVRAALLEGVEVLDGMIEVHTPPQSPKTVPEDVARAFNNMMRYGGRKLS